MTFGGKWYGVGAVAVLGIAWLVVRAVRRDKPPKVARDAIVLGAWVLALGGVWLLRNWVAAGDPLFPLDVKPLGISIFDAPPDPVRDAFGGKIADYFGNWHIIRHVLIPSWHKAFGTPGR